MPESSSLFANEIEKPLSPSSLITLMFVFIILSGIGVTKHELWLDEMHHWLLGRDSASFMELWKNTRYDGHPILWNIILYLITRFTGNPIWMQIFHICISSTVVFVFLKFAPFSKFFKSVFIFGYFPFYEYNILSRNYSIGFLFLLMCCLFYNQRRSNYIKISIILTLAANTHLFTLIVASVFFIILLIDFLSTINSASHSTKKTAAIGLTIFIFGVIVSLIQIKVPDDHSYKVDFDHLLSIKRVGHAFLVILKSLAPFPDIFSYNYWNTNIFISASKVLGGILNISLFLIPSIIFINKRHSFILFYLGTLLFIILFYFSQLQALRYYGFVYILFILSLWISKYDQPQLFINKGSSFRFGNILNTKLKDPLIYGILIIQLLSGITVYALDLIRPFSQAEQTINYLKKNNLENKFIVASTYLALPPLSGYLGKEIYSLELQSFGSFCHWNIPFDKFIATDEEVISRIKCLDLKKQKNIILILNRELSLQNEDLNFHLIKKIEGSVVRNESFYIYTYP